MRLNTALLLTLATLPCTALGAVDLAEIDRSILREPEYENDPHYALIVFGLNGEHRSWLVMDGDETLYFDRNGNGDLTEPDDRMELDKEGSLKINMAEGSAYSGMHVFPIGKIADTHLTFRFWVRKRGFIPSDERIRNILKKRAANNWETGTLWRVAEDGSQAQNGICLTAQAEDAQITHLNGPLTFGLKWNDRQRLQPWPKKSTLDVHIGTPSLPAKNSEHSVFSPLTVKEIPTDVHPTAVLELPTDPPTIREIELEERCCGDTVYARLELPPGVPSGIVKVALSYPDWRERDVQPATFEIPIEEGRSTYLELSFIMFSSEEHDPDMSAIRRALINQEIPSRLSKYDESETLIVQVQTDKYGSPPSISVTKETGSEVTDTATALLNGGEYDDYLSKCDARLTIGYLNIDDILEEEKTITTILTVLQEATGGVLYNTWERELVGPKWSVSQLIDKSASRLERD